MAAAKNLTSQLSSKSPTIRRILREAAEISSSPSADYAAEPLESDFFEWHFTLRGPPNSVYGEGLYHGRIVLPSTYPLRPPSFRFMTPNGRFEANREICLSISGHHEETWQPAWGIRTAIVALRSFMETDARGQLGGLDTTDEVRRRLARESRDFRCSTCGRSNLEIITLSEQQVSQLAVPSGKDIQVPTELSMAWKDEMITKRPVGDGHSLPSDRLDNGSQDGDSDAAETTEVFAQTSANPQTRGKSQESSTHGNEPSSSTSPRHDEGHAPTTSRVTEAAASEQALTRRPPRTLQPHDEGVPLWVDRAIVALVIVLIALLLKVLVGF
ncbi:uncharacterized protein UV8b_03222 [Ustilaginoidea virens]|uniref:UBC core domain-containing protein n=1 Tax=Ustilaginoidea virens TaxID=1159556 RepID=A0A1B5L5N4_USTVR|nr:uncharacterized protein UV8b_03222 [Ustilaginoidea virens]QUC18981.1 hypothetical protein UV8b_03222 [Ustilaginoidea virens]GAO17875.1 hypothetical protein UVI_02030270 [Ustilaginoidea virens]